MAVEADWPDAYRVNRYVIGLSDDADADTALSDFRRFPAWMWRTAMFWPLSNGFALATTPMTARSQGALLRSGPLQPPGFDGSRGEVP